LAFVVAGLGVVWLVIVVRTRRVYIREFRRQLGDSDSVVSRTPGLWPLAADRCGHVSIEDADDALTRLLAAPPTGRSELYCSLVVARQRRTARRRVDLPSWAVKVLLDEELLTVDRHLRAGAALELASCELGVVGSSRPGHPEAVTRTLGEDVERILLLCAASHSRATVPDILTVMGALRSPASRTRASALELLDNVLARSVRKRVVPVLEAVSDGTAVRAQPERPSFVSMGASTPTLALAQALHRLLARPVASPHAN
jgi:hypothetical protein